MTVVGQDQYMERRKTTVYLDPDVLTAAKVLAAARRQSESQVVEDALRAYLRDGQLNQARSSLKDLMDRIAARNAGDALDDDQAMEIAVQEVRATRAARRSRRSA